MRRLLCLTVAATLLFACAGMDDGGDAAPTASPAPAVDLPDTPVAAQLQWVLDVLAGEATADDDALSERFDGPFLAEVPAAQLRQVFRQFAAEWTVTGYDAAPDGLQAVATIEEPDGAVFELLGVVDPDPPHRLTGLLFRPPTEAIDPPDDFDELSSRLAEQAPTTVVYASEVTDGTCVPLHADAADLPVPVGSAFKLYVLGAVADAVVAGDLDWGEPLRITDEVRSLPSGRLQEEETGTEVTVREAAGLMIEISDNTATDLLIDRLGRERVEAAQSGLGHHDPTLNVPFLTTRELFQLKWQLTDAERADYLGADAEQRRQFLDDDLAGRDLDVDVASVTTPVEVETLEWFTTAEDLCRVHVALADAGHEPATAPVREILSANPGTVVDPERWDHVGFKGGSEPGVLALSWYLEAVDGRAYVLSGAAVDPDSPLDESTIVQLLSAGIDLLP